MGVQRTMKNCCCGCSLRTGAIIIGTLAAIIGASLLFMIMHIVILPQPEMIRLRYVLYMVISLAQMLTGVMLVIGADKSRPSYVRPWLGFSYCKLALDFLSSGAAIYYLLAAHAPTNVMLTVIATITGYLSLEVYCIIVVFSFYKQLTGTDGIIPLKDEV